MVRAQRDRERLPCLLLMQATAGPTPALLAFTPEQCPSWPRERAPRSPAGGFVTGHDDMGWTVFPLQSTSGRHFVARPSHGHVPCLATRVVSLLLLQFAVLQVMVRARR